MLISRPPSPHPEVSSLFFMAVERGNIMEATKRRILCIDDHDSRNLPVFLLAGAGYEVTTAGSANEALGLAADRPFDLYLINERFGDGTGLELCDRLGEYDPHTPVLF